MKPVDHSNTNSIGAARWSGEAGTVVLAGAAVGWATVIDRPERGSRRTAWRGLAVAGNRRACRSAMCRTRDARRTRSRKVYFYRPPHFCSLVSRRAWAIARPAAGRSTNPESSDDTDRTAAQTCLLRQE